MAVFNLTCPNPTHQHANIGHLTSFLFQTLIQAQCGLGSTQRFPPDARGFLLDEYDFIVVGAGTAGNVLASRLTEPRPNGEPWTVLLIEAGTYPSEVVSVPFLWHNSLRSFQDWNFTTESQERACLGGPQRKCVFSRGKMVGGSAGLNAMFYIRAHPNDFRDWAALGNLGWDWEDVLPIYQSLEGYQVSGDPDPEVNVDIEKEGVGQKGPLTLTIPVKENPLSTLMRENLKRQGLREIQSMGGQYEGYQRALFTVFNGERMSTARAYLSPARDRPNLHLLTESQVSKILIEGKRAIGVEVHSLKIGEEHRLQRIFARKEVILSAGSIATPGILQNSGIGPRELLKSLDIGLIKELPVGENLADHVFVPGIFTILPSEVERDLNQDWAEYLLNKTGLFASIGVTELNIFHTSKYNIVPNYPDIGLIYFHLPKGDVSLIKNIMNETYREILDDLSTRNSLLISAAYLFRPKSRGRISLAKKDPNLPMKIEQNFFDENDDILRMIEALKFAFNLSNSQFLQSQGFKSAFLLNGDTNSDKYWEQIARTFTTSVCHPSGTARMALDDPINQGVVDDYLRVYGIPNLRVIDASVIPTMTTSHLNSVVVMIAERGSEFIKRQNNF